ncbi:hypothetical protein [Clostridium sp.]|uniref:hypothetical protein n=1 Tax=Clostridium sp. TaxID=1506 RepID=UPI00261BF4CB|nr:hypothetical protein [Clostridium sp.]
MNYYIKTLKELNYELSEPFNTYEEAESKYKHLHEKTKRKSTIIKIPYIKNGLVLYKNNEPYKTIVGYSANLYFLKKNPYDNNEMTDIVRKEILIKWFIEEKLNPIEEYKNDIQFHNVDEMFSKSDIVFTEEDN